MDVCLPFNQPCNGDWDYLTQNDSRAGKRCSVGNSDHDGFIGEKAQGHPGIELGRVFLRH